MPSKEERSYAAKIMRRLRKAYPEATCSLDFRNPLELLVATILSAQCTDARVNLVTPDLFAAYPTAADYAATPVMELEKLIKSTGFYKNKAKHIRGAAQAIVERHDSEVPQTMEELVELPGVGRKTANCVLGTAFGKPVGVVVDTHVGRIARRIGVSDAKQPEKIEQDLMSIFPRRDWISLSHLLIQLGREFCTSRRAKCDEGCPLVDVCPKND